MGGRALDGWATRHARHIVIIHHVQIFKMGVCGVLVFIIVLDTSPCEE